MAFWKPHRAEPRRWNARQRMALATLALLASAPAWLSAACGAAWRPTIDDLPVRRAEFQVALNQASPAELCLLPGIGPTLAARIVAGRPFERVDELLQVRGIGAAKLSAIREQLRLDDEEPSFGL